MFYWLLKWILIGPLVRLLYRPRISGLEHIPAEGPAIIAPNHLSFCDSVFVPLLAPQQVHYVAKAEYFTGAGLKGRLTAWFFTGAGAVPVDRSGGRASVAAIDTGLRTLREGKLFGIYPEGTRSPDGRLHRGRTGVARLALSAGVPVIPVGLIGTDRVQPSGRLLWRLGPRPEVRFGPPLDFSRYEGLADDRYVLRAVTDEIVAAILDLSGQEYVDMYATKAKALARRAAAAAAPADEELPRAA
ncbi:lysophospholipid acyltransferase family protein [Streptacidiphilus carbonis]|uniref:lysophospholipid acyltransferase family protein n=1 Tax=Streptacidiphilus carbonis TaxID=105422 RepID=UPI0005A948BE|nr:lysophospholipid acyltransferase family protein [Streptacidiphilus carbonis]